MLGLVNIQPMPLRGTAGADYRLAPSSGGYGEDLVDLNGSASLWRTDDSQLLARGGWSTRFIDSELRFPDTGAAIPDQFDRAELSLTWLHRDGEDGIGYLGSLGLVATSDELDFSSDQLEVTALAGVSVPVREHDHWLALVFWNSRSEILDGAPVPGLAYHWQASEDLELIIGIPVLSLRWHFAPTWTADLNLLGGRAGAGVSWQPQRGHALRLALGREQWRSWRHDRLDDDVAIRNQAWRIGIDYRARLAGGWSASLGAGYLFERYLAETEVSSRFYDQPEDNRLRLESGALFTIGISRAFR